MILTATGVPVFGSKLMTMPWCDGIPSLALSLYNVTSLVASALSFAEYAGIVRRTLK